MLCDSEKAFRALASRQGFFLAAPIIGRCSGSRPCTSSSSRAGSPALFYLPRIFVNLASVPADSHAERERLLLMARQAVPLREPADAAGDRARAACCGWATASAAGRATAGCMPSWLLVVLALGYHHACRSLLRKFEQFANQRSERWFRVFNEAAVLLFAAIVILVVVKPF